MGSVSAVVSTMGSGFAEVCISVVMSSSIAGLKWKEEQMMNHRDQEHNAKKQNNQDMWKKE